MVSLDQEFSPKLTPPRRRQDTIRRERLHRALSDALESEVIVVSAPAGYGKSTLAIDWYDDAGLPAAWLSVDRQDLDPLTLLSNLVGAIRVAFRGALQELNERLRGGAEPAHATALVGQFVANVHREIDDMFLLIVDDLHVLDDAPGTLELLDTLVRGLPMNMRLYVLSRTWPRLPSLTRMTAQRRASSLGAADLEFTDDEAVEFMRRSGVDGASGIEVVERAGGWAAALAILADHYDPSRPHGGTVPGSEFVLSDFVEHEVLGQLPAPQFELLSACSVLESFDAEHAEELTGDPEARAPAGAGEHEPSDHEPERPLAAHALAAARAPAGATREQRPATAAATAPLRRRDVRPARAAPRGGEPLDRCGRLAGGRARGARPAPGALPAGRVDDALQLARSPAPGDPGRGRRPHDDPRPAGDEDAPGPGGARAARRHRRAGTVRRPASPARALPRGLAAAGGTAERCDRGLPPRPAGGRRGASRRRPAVPGNRPRGGRGAGAERPVRGLFRAVPLRGGKLRPRRRPASRRGGTRRLRTLALLPRLADRVDGAVHGGAAALAHAGRPGGTDRDDEQPR